LGDLTYFLSFQITHNNKGIHVFAINNFSQFVSFSTIAHQQAAYCIIHYLNLNGTPSNGILFRSDSFIELKAFCDFDWTTSSLVLASTLMIPSYL